MSLEADVTVVEKPKNHYQRKPGGLNNTHYGIREVIHDPDLPSRPGWWDDRDFEKR